MEAWQWLTSGGGLLTLVSVAGKAWKAWNAKTADANKRVDELHKHYAKEISDLNQRHAAELRSLNEAHKADLRQMAQLLSEAEQMTSTLERSLREGKKSRGDSG